MMKHNNFRVFITSCEDNTIFGEKVLQEPVYDGETLVSDSYSVSLRHDFKNNELQDLLAQKANPTTEELEALLAADDNVFGFNKSEIEM